VKDLQVDVLDEKPPWQASSRQAARQRPLGAACFCMWKKSRLAPRLLNCIRNVGAPCLIERNTSLKQLGSLGLFGNGYMKW